MTVRTILLGVTSDVSIGLMTGFPAYLADQGWEVHVVSAGGPKSRALEGTPGVSVHTLPMRRDPAPLADLRSLLTWIRLLHAIKPDVVSVGTPKAGLLGGIAGWLTRVPARVYMLRGLRYETTSGQRRNLLRQLEKLSAGTAHRVVAVSESLRRIAVADRLGPAWKFDVIGSGSSNGVDIAHFATTSQQREAAQQEHKDITPVIGFIGRIHPDKGLDLLARATEVLARRGTLGSLLVVGASDDPQGENLRTTLEESSWDVTLTGPVSDVAPLLRRMDVLCLPTLREGFPNVVLEAAAAGIPTVATAATGVSDSIVDGETGLVCADRDPEHLADLLARLLDSSELRNQLGNQANMRTLAHFGREQVWKNAEKYYASLFKMNARRD